MRPPCATLHPGTAEGSLSDPAIYIAHTRRQWFDYLSTIATPDWEGPSVARVRLDEANFWSPHSPRPPKSFAPGEPMFLRLGKPDRALVGFGFYATHHLVDVHTAWDLFGRKNGAGTLSELAVMLGRTSEAALAAPLSCTVLRDLVLWPESRWIPWGEDRGYPTSGAQRGRTDRENTPLLWGLLAEGRPPPEVTQPFVPRSIDERRYAVRDVPSREGQATFRLRLLKAYQGQCAITREHTAPVLQAAHIQPYLGPESNHLQNGLLLTSEFHKLFDLGLVGVEPPTAGRDSYRLRVSRQLHARWNNGRRYTEYDATDLAVPQRAAERPSQEALQWHLDVRFERSPA